MERRDTLLLNASYEPLTVISWQRAVTMFFGDKVEVLEEYDDFHIKSVSFTMKCPAVVRLRKYIKGDKSKVKFSRVNVFGRDNYSCQYCGIQPGAMKLTYDHVLPKSRGGRTDWNNIVTSCLPCNARKADRTPEEAKMFPFKAPRRPDDRPEASITILIPKTPEAWKNYLYLTEDLDAQ